MQENSDAGAHGPTVQPDFGATGVLEDPDRVDINGLATLEISNRCEDDPSGVYSKDRFAAKLYYYDRLYWLHKAALLLKQGATVQQVLGTSWVVIEGKTLPDWHPRPGIELVIIAQIIGNPGALTPAHIFFEICQALRK